MVSCVEEWSRQRTCIELSEYINTMFSLKASLERRPPNRSVWPPTSKRKTRKVEYAIIQNQWQKTPGQRIRDISDGFLRDLVICRPASATAVNSTLNPFGLLSSYMRSGRPAACQIPYWPGFLAS